jgi:hypothetical protein
MIDLEIFRGGYRLSPIKIESIDDFVARWLKKEPAEKIMKKIEALNFRQRIGGGDTPAFVGFEETKDEIWQSLADTLVVYSNAIILYNKNLKRIKKYDIQNRVT